MGLRTWVKHRLGLIPEQPATSIDLAAEGGQILPAPQAVGLSMAPPAQPWSVARLSGLFRDAQNQPSASTLHAARMARHRLSMFWLGAPVDLLDQMYEGPIGDLQRQQLEGILVQQDLATDEKQWRDLLTLRMGNPEERSRQLNLILAIIPYTKPGKLKLQNPIETLPTWLLRDYVSYCAPELKHELDGPAGLLNPAEEHESDELDDTISEFAPLTDRRGEDAMTWFQDEKALSRMKALINLYGMAPDDQETLAELSGLRKVVAQLWLDVQANQLEALYQLPVGLITRSLITSGFGKVLLDQEDERARAQLAPLAADFSDSRNHGALLATLLFFAPEGITFETTDGLPEWLVNELSSF
jgi:hypothetical protein